MDAAAEVVLVFFLGVGGGSGDLGHRLPVLDRVIIVQYVSFGFRKNEV
jgi:hypothetical protein